MNYNNQLKKQIQYILDNGTMIKGRNGKALTVPFYSFILDFTDNSWKLTLRKTYYKGIKAEWNTLMDLKTPLTNVSQFETNGCNYWSLWAKKDGSLNLDYYNMLHPQLEDVIENIKKDPNSRRHVVSLWNHNNVQLNKLSLTCCWEQMIFSIINNKVYMTFNIRSNDLMLGQQADVYLAYLFMEHVAKETGYKMGHCMFGISNLHIYEEHIDNAKKLLNRTKNDYNKPLKFELKA